MRAHLPTALLTRGTATARIAARVAHAGGARLLARTGAARDQRDGALGEALFDELDNLKGMAMKVGQILSYMDVGLPEHTVERLSRLQSGVSPLDTGVIVAAIEQELGAGLDTLFDQFDPVPVAAASVGQVHRAVLRGQPVAVKVRYPGVRETMASDMRQVGGIAGLASLATAVDGASLVADLRDRLLEECDYAQEARNQAQFGSIYAGDHEITVPEVFADRSSAGVLTTSWCAGVPLTDLLAGRASAPPDRRLAIARTLARLTWHSLFQHQLLHADPHPGNFLWSGDRLVVLDYGAVKRFTPEEIAALRALVSAVVRDDRAALLDTASAVGLLPRPDRVDLDELWLLLRWMFAPYCGRPSADVGGPACRLDRTWWLEGRRFTAPGHVNARHLAVPPAWMWVQRAAFGLHAVLTRLLADVDAPPLLAPILTAALA